MTKGRTLLKYGRAYIDGYDVSGFARSIGPLSESFEEGKDDPLNAALVGILLGQATISPGTLNSIFDNTSDTGIHAVMKAGNGKRNVMWAQGVQAVPAAGDPVFCGQFLQTSYITDPAATPSALSVNFAPNSGAASSDNNSLAYPQAWGVLLHANTSENAANTDIGIDLASLGIGTSDTSTDGGYMMYQITAGAGAGGLAAIKVQDATSNVDAGFADLLSTGDIDVGTAPAAGVVALATTGSVRQYIRWQLALNTATECTFLLAFVRGRPR